MSKLWIVVAWVPIVVAVGCDKDAREYVRKSKQSEGDLVLNRIAKAAKTRAIRMGAFPVGTAGPTPAGSCCDGPGHKCVVDRAQWASDPVWSALELEIDEPHRFRFSYRGTEKEFVATAEADLDCDAAGTTVITATGTIGADGRPATVFSTIGND